MKYRHVHRVNVETGLSSDLGDCPACAYEEGCRAGLEDIRKDIERIDLFAGIEGRNPGGVAAIIVNKILALIDFKDKNP